MGTSFRFSELRKLHALGFTLHWLKPHSKSPYLGWNKTPRLEFEAFKKAYRKGNNVGVRLGKTSVVKGGVLAVIDFDVKGTKPEHLEEARAKLLELFPETENAPTVLSGRGNGSAHFYIAVPEPISGQERKGQSSEIVKIQMKSVEPSKRERETFSEAELSAGWRLRPAWEISILCEGRQVVLGGSVHPDTGRHYVWKPGTESKPLPRIGLERAKGNAETAKAVLSTREQPGVPLAPLQLRKVVLEKLGLRDDQVAAIEVGAGVTDRSASVFALTMALLQRRVSEIDILSVFTDRDYFLGHTAFDHAKTTDPQRAARWLLKYTLPRARQQTNESAFSHEIIEEANTPEGKATAKANPVKQAVAIKEISGAGAEAFEEAGEWKQQLDLQPGPKGAPPQIRSSFKNLCLILTNTIGPDFIRHDEFAQREFWAYDVPWGIKEGAQRSGGTADELKLKNFLIEVWGIESSVNMLTETLAFFAGQNFFHPVKDYLEGLEWDGVERIEDAFESYLGARMPKPYLTAVSKKFFLALIARIYQPGVKFDHLPVLEGFQGIGKSTFPRVLVGEKWFMDGLPDLADKDAALNLTGIWLCEMSELSSLYRAQLEVAKAFITRQTDKVRPPYGARRIDLPRQTVFLGTTNDRDYLVDSTGNRRFWPVLIRGCNFKKLARDREQLLAEAYWCYFTDMEPLYLQGQAEKQAKAIQESRRVEDESDSIASKISEWVAAPASQRSIKDITRVKLDDLFDSGPLFGIQKTATTRKMAGQVLRRAGYQKIVTGGGKLWVTHKMKQGRKA